MNPLERLAKRSSAGFPNLFRAREHTARRLEDTRARLSDTSHDSDASVVLFGSWGRQELTDHSDDDWAVLVGGSEKLDTRPPATQIGELLGVEERKPGSQEVFGCTIFCRNLVERIGLDEDDNKNLTRRILLLLESVSVLNESPLQDCWHGVLDGYLDDSVKGYRPPRFLLNDMIRYWRTVCVDFVGKERASPGEKWALRNLKLRLSRKALFAGGLPPVLLCHRYALEDIRPFLVESLQQPSIDRVASAFVELDAIDAGIRLGADFQRGLLALLFETSLEPLVREYGIF